MLGKKERNKGEVLGNSSQFTAKRLPHKQICSARR